MRLVIAEKRSVAFAIAQALGGVRQGDGYVSARGALISWAQGHLVELSDPEEYSDMPWSAHKWTMDSLPIDPKSWRWRLSGAKGAAQRYRSLVELLRSDKVTELVNACDPDREGEGRLAGRYERVTCAHARMASQPVARTRAHSNVDHGRPT